PTAGDARASGGLATHVAAPAASPRHGGGRRTGSGGSAALARPLQHGLRPQGGRARTPARGARRQDDRVRAIAGDGALSAPAAPGTACRGGDGRGRTVRTGGCRTRRGVAGLRAARPGRAVAGPRARDRRPDRHRSLERGVESSGRRAGDSLRPAVEPRAAHPAGGPNRSRRIAPCAHRDDHAASRAAAGGGDRPRAPPARQGAGAGPPPRPAGRARPATLDPAALTRAIERAAPLVRARLGAVEAARWRAEDRDRLGRRLIPWVLAAARRAAQRREHAELARLDALISRLALGMTAGEELLLEDLLARGGPLAVRDVLAWHERLAPAAEG